VPATIVGCGAAAPADVLTNAELEAVLDTSDRWIVERTGIRERRIAADGESSASLGVAAGRAALTDAGIAAGDVDMLVVATATPEQPIPHTGAFVADGLGLACGSFDVGAGCAGFVYAVVVAAALLGTGTVRNVLVVGTETLSRVVDPADRSTRILFGDAAEPRWSAPRRVRAGSSPGPGLRRLGGRTAHGSRRRKPAAGEPRDRHLR